MYQLRLVLWTIFVIGVVMGCGKAKDDDLSIDQVGIQSLEGKWTTTCRAGGSAHPHKDELRFYGSKVNYQLHIYQQKETGCTHKEKVAILELTRNYRFEAKDEVPTVKTGALPKVIEYFNSGSATVTPITSVGADILNINEVCGLINWRVGVSQPIASTCTEILGIALDTERFKDRLDVIFLNENIRLQLGNVAKTEDTKKAPSALDDSKEYMSLNKIKKASPAAPTKQPTEQ